MPYSVGGFGNEESVKAALERDFEGLGKHNITVKRRVEFGAGGKTYVPNEYEVWISNPAVAKDSWYGSIQAGPNDSLMVRQGMGMQMFPGDLLPIAESGITAGLETVPYYTGRRSFARRVAAAFGNIANMGEDTARYLRTNVNKQFYQINDQEMMSGRQYTSAQGNDLGWIPGNQMYVSPIESPTKLRYLSTVKNAPIIGKAEESIKAFINQVNEKRGNPAWRPLVGGAFLEPRTSGDRTTAGLYVPELAYGTQYENVLPSGAVDILTAAMTQKGVKQKYSAGQREIAGLYVNTGSRLVPLDNNLLSETGAVLDASTYGTFKGVRTSAATALGALPWQSGMGRLQLPENVRQAITSQGERDMFGNQSGGYLEAGMPTKQDINLSGFTSLSQMLQRKWNLDQSQINRLLPQGRSINIGTWEGPDLPTGESGDVGLKITPGQQHTAISGYELQVPQGWFGPGEGDTEIERLYSQFQERGISRITRFSGDAPRIRVNMTMATAPAMKGLTKSSIGVPLQGESLAIQRRGGMGTLPINVLEEAKGIDIITQSSLYGMPTTGDRSSFNFMRTVFGRNQEDAGINERITEYEKAYGGGPIDLLALSKQIGYQTGEELISNITGRALQYRPNPTGRVTEWQPTQITDIDQAFNERLLQEFGYGRVQGRVQVEQIPANQIKDWREQVITQALMPTRYDDNGIIEREAVSREEAERIYRERVQPNLQLARTGKNKGLYTLFSPEETEFLVHPELTTFTTETVGIGSDMGDVNRALEAQNMRRESLWYQRNYSKMFPEQRAQLALRDIYSAFGRNRVGLTTAEGSLIVSGTRATGPGVVNTEDITNLLVGSSGNENPLNRLQNIREAIRTLAKIPEDQGDQNLLFEKQGMTFPSPQAWLDVETKQMEETAGGALQGTTQAHVADQANKLLERLLVAERSGIQDIATRNESMALMSKYTNSEKLYKRFGGGGFSRYITSELLAPHEVGVTDQWLQRMYLLGGGKAGSNREYKQFLSMAEGSLAMAVRQPAPNIGTENAPGSYYPVQLLTPKNKRMQDIMAGFKREGVMPAEVITSARYKASMGDADLDPMSLFPFLFKEKGRWNRYEPEAGIDRRQYLRDLLVKRNSPEMQRQAFEMMWGAYATTQSPYDVNVQKAFTQTLGKGGEDLLSKRLTLNLTNLQDQISTWNKIKTREMGTAYNSFLRRTEAAATQLGIPSGFIPNIRDKAAQYYQNPLDFKLVSTSWENLLNTAGFFPGSNGSVQWGFNESLVEGKTKFTTSYWSPQSSDTKSFSRVLGSVMSTMPNVRPEWIAGMLMNVPERGAGASDDEYNRVLAERQEQISARLRPVYDRRNEMQPQQFHEAALQEINKMVDEDLMGDRSIGVYGAMSRNFEYAGKDATRWADISKAMQRENGQGLFTIQGQKMTAEQAASVYAPTSLMYEFSKRKGGSWMDVANMAGLFVSAQEQGFGGSQMIQQMWENFGKPLMITNPNQGDVSVADPLDPNKTPRILKTQQDVNDYRASIQEYIQNTVRAYAQGNEGGVRNLSFSSIGAEAAIVNSGQLYEDSYRRMLTAGAMYGWANPAFIMQGRSGIAINKPQDLVGTRGSPGNPLFFSTGTAANTGNAVEAMVEELAKSNPDIGRMLGGHIGQLPGGKAPRYTVFGPEGQEMRIAGIPDFPKVTQSGDRFTVNTGDWKNLPSQQGKTREQILQYISDNPAYMTQIPGYSLMYAQPWKLDETARNAMLESARTPEDKAVMQRYLALQESEMGRITTESTAYVSTEQTGTKESIRRRHLKSGLVELTKGGENRYVRKFTLSSNQVTPQWIKEQDEALYGKAALAQEGGLTTALDAAYYQSYVMKDWANKNTSFLQKMGLSGEDKFRITPEEDAAKYKWETGARREGETRFENYRWEFNPAYSDQFAGIYGDIQTQIQTLSLGRDQGTRAPGNVAPVQNPQIPPPWATVTGGGGSGGAGEPPVATDSPTPERPQRRPRQARQMAVGGTGGNDQQSASLMTEVLSRFQGIMENVGGKQVIKFPGKRQLSPTVAADLFQQTATLSEKFLGKLDDASMFQPGELVQAYKNMPQLLAQGMTFGDDAAKQAFLAMEPNQALTFAKNEAMEGRFDLRGFVKKNPQMIETMQKFKVMDFLTGNMRASMGARADDLDSQFPGQRNIISSAPMGETNPAYPEVAQAMGGFRDIAGVSQKLHSPTKRETLLSAQEKAVYMESTQSYQEKLDAFAKVNNHILKLGDSMLSFGKRLEEVDKAVIKSANNQERYAKATGMLDEVREGRTQLNLATARVRQQFGIGDVTNKEPLTKAELDRAYAASTVRGEAADLFNYEKMVANQADVENRIAGAATGRGPDQMAIGRLARSMLGGFGMMYMKTIAGYAVEPTRFGYEGYNQEEAINRQIMAQRFGGGATAASPEDYVNRMTASYGGAGWAMIRNAQGGMYAKQPGLTTATNLVGAGLASAGLLTTLGMWTGAGMAAVQPYLLPLAGATMAAAYGIESYGSASQTDRNAATLTSQMMRGVIQYDPTKGKFSGGGTFLNTATAGFGITQNNGDFENQKPVMDRLSQMMAYERSGGRDLRGYLAKQGMSVPEINRYMGIYNQAGISTLPQFSAESLYQTMSIRDTYGISAITGTGGTFETMAGWSSGGINYEQLAMQMAAGPNTSLAEQQKRAGTIIENLAAQQARGGQPLDALALAQMTLGAQRRVGLGEFAPNLGVTEGTPERTILSFTNKRYYLPHGQIKDVPVPQETIVPAIPGKNLDQPVEEQLASMSEFQYSAYRERFQRYQRRKAYGLSGEEPAREDFIGDWTETQKRQEQRYQEESSIRDQLLTQAINSMNTLGITMAKLQDYDKMTVLGQKAYVGKLEAGTGIAMSLMQGGMGESRAQQIGSMFEGMTEQEAYKMQQVMSLSNPMAMSEWAMRNGAKARGLPQSLTGWGGAQIPIEAMFMTDVNAQGQLTGMNWGSSTLAFSNQVAAFQGNGINLADATKISSGMTANKIWGANFLERKDVSQGLIQALVEGGTLGGQMWQFNQQYDISNRQIGLQQQQAKLQYAFTTGIGLNAYTGTINPQTGQPFGINTSGGGFWGLEDRQRQMGYEQTQWSMDMQQRQLDMNDRFFRENNALNRRQNIMQRGWSRQDWQQQDMVRNMQWGWQVEDFEEEKRFLTGRDRRIAERQQKRATTMHNVEEEQIVKERSRQEQLWRLEDERYRLGLKQHSEQMKLQEESIDKQRAFFEERKKLEAESVALQRAFWVEQQKLQQAGIGLQQEQNNLQKEIAKTMLEFDQYVTRLSAAGKLTNPDTMAEWVDLIFKVSEPIQEITGALTEFFLRYGSTEAPSGTETTTTTPTSEKDGTNPVPQSPGRATPVSRSNPWQNQVVPKSVAAKTGATPTVVTINIGGSHFKDVIIDAVEKEINI